MHNEYDTGHRLGQDLADDPIIRLPVGSASFSALGQLSSSRVIDVPRHSGKKPAGDSVIIIVFAFPNIVHALLPAVAYWPSVT